MNIPAVDTSLSGCKHVCNWIKNVLFTCSVYEQWTRNQRSPSSDVIIRSFQRNGQLNWSWGVEDLWAKPLGFHAKLICLKMVNPRTVHFAWRNQWFWGTPTLKEHAHVDDCRNVFLQWLRVKKLPGTPGTLSNSWLMDVDSRKNRMLIPYSWSMDVNGCWFPIIIAGKHRFWPIPKPRSFWGPRPYSMKRGCARYFFLCVWVWVCVCVCSQLWLFFEGKMLINRGI